MPHKTPSLPQMGFSAQASIARTTSSDILESENREPISTADAIKDRKKSYSASIRKVVLVGQNLAWHQAVLGLLKIQMSRRERKTREQMALYVARSHSRGLYFARKIIAWERS